MTIPEQPLDPPEDNSIKSNVAVRLRCIIIKEITCSGCTLEQAMDDPYAYWEAEKEIDEEYEVLSVQDKS